MPRLRRAISATPAASAWTPRIPAERLALELADKVGDFVGEADAGAPAAGGPAAGALRALEKLGYSTAEADKALRRALAGDGGKVLDAEALVRRALQLLTER